MLTISRQLPYSAAQMYTLVNDVARYPEFVPFCVGAVIHEANPNYMRAALTVEWQGVHKTLTTENKLVENQSINMTLVQGPVKKLQGQWQFRAIDATHCQVELSILLEFNNRLLAMLFTGVAKQVTHRLVDAFCARAKVLYGG